MTLNVKFTTVEPLLQIEGTRKDESGMDVITQKRSLRFFEIDGETKTIRTPIYSANGFRGAMRRVGTNIILSALSAKGLRIKGDVNFHLMNAGGGNNYQSQTLEVEKAVRELNPLVSLFGASLAIKGKLSVSDLVPLRMNPNGDFVPCYGVSDGYLYSDIVEVRKFVKVDDMLRRGENSVFLTEEEIVAWELSVGENQSLRATERADSKKAVKKKSISHIQSREQVASGVDFYGTITDIYPLTSIERGLLVRIMEKIAYRKLGSNSSVGLGAGNYSISGLNGEVEIKTTRDICFHGKINNRIFIDDSLLEDVNAFDRWLLEISEENVNLDKILV